MNELKLFLEEHPHLKPYQIRLKKEMDAVPEEYRLTVLAKHIAWNMEELETELRLLQLKLTELGDNYEGNS
jgi:hypothetical protein